MLVFYDELSRLLQSLDLLNYNYSQQHRNRSANNAVLYPYDVVSLKSPKH